MKFDELVRSSRDPAFACNSDCRIVAWNRAAEELLGVPSRQAIGRVQHDLVPARDTYGNRFCSCVVGPLAARGEIVRHQYIHVPTASGAWLKASLCTVSLTPSGPKGLHLHFLRPMDWHEVDGDESAGIGTTQRGRSGSIGGSGHSPVAAPGTAVPEARRWRLTSREVDVLRLMMEGKGAKESAQALNVSTATVRNHIRALLRKLRVHSKLEAIALVLRAAPGDRARRVAAEGPSR
ncbi:MAG: LuxR C-terminal-related transcriptional regulator [Acidobacteriia bacterium]|nr:LuxR C-terminal-related transcriptional regulator [Terriglobia bacterium]